MQATLFGVVETRTETKDRAKELRSLYNALKDAPQAIECRQSQTLALQYFVTRSDKNQFDLNDRDGLQRLIGQPEELLTERDCASMRRNRKIWKPLKYDFVGFKKGELYCTKLHPKEVAYLKQTSVEIQREIDTIERNVPIIRKQIEKLRAVGPLPLDVAERLRLTEDGREKEIKMKLNKIVYTPEAGIEFTSEDVRILIKYAESHYDMTCQLTAEPGGMLYGLKNQCELSKGKAERFFTAHEIDLLSKVMESFCGNTTPAEEKIQTFLQETFQELNDSYITRRQRK